MFKPTEELLGHILSQNEADLGRFLQRTVLPAQVGDWAVYVRDPGHGELELIHPLSDGDERKRLQLEMTQPVVNNGVLAVGGRWLESQDGRHQLVFPLFFKSKPVGILVGRARIDEPSRQKVVRILEARKQLLARALEMRRVLREKEQLAFTDNLTGLYNSYFLSRALENEIRRSRRYGKPLSVLFIDVDLFKRVNDAHGHVVGSETLREVGHVLQSVIRESDLISRFGGDEFVIVTDKLDLEGAEVVAERVRRAVHKHRFGKNSNKGIRLTVSVGLATFPENGTSARQLIDAADRAMYRAKQDRGNCVRSVG